jgi:hypothetical protein
MMKINNQKGFALLLTIVVVSVVVAIGLSLLENSIKQLYLSGIGRDSEIAFHNSYAGIECARYWVTNQTDQFLKEAVPANPPTPARAFFLSGARCFHNVIGYVSVYLEPAPNVHRSAYTVNWGPINGACTAMDIYIFDATGGPVTYNIPISGIGSKTCAVGNRCTYVLSRGYNQSCNYVNSGYRAVQRELIMEF